MQTLAVPKLIPCTGSKRGFLFGEYQEPAYPSQRPQRSEQGLRETV